MAAPSQTLEVTGNRDRRGKFLPGHSLPGPGRPKGIGNIRTIATERAEAEGVDLQQAIWEVLKSLFVAAQRGDVAAARLLLDRLPERPEGALPDRIVNVFTGVPQRVSELDDLA